ERQLHIGFNLRLQELRGGIAMASQAEHGDGKVLACQMGQEAAEQLANGVVPQMLRNEADPDAGIAAAATRLELAGGSRRRHIEAGQGALNVAVVEALVG